MGLVKLYTGRDSLDAHHLHHYLQTNGISSTVMGETLSVARGDLPMTAETLPAVWVHKEDAPRAMELANAYINTPKHDDPEVVAKRWNCPDCGELIEGQFEACWNCGATNTNPD